MRALAGLFPTPPEWSRRTVCVYIRRDTNASIHHLIKYTAFTPHTYTTPFSIAE